MWVHIVIVTPFMGVWIEIEKSGRKQRKQKVTPFMGVWIEISKDKNTKMSATRHTLYGCVD